MARKSPHDGAIGLSVLDETGQSPEVSSSRAVKTLLHSLRGGLAGAAQAHTWEIDVADWPEVIAAAIAHRVEPLLYARARAVGPAAAIPDEVMQRLEELYCCHALRNQQLFRQLAALLSTLDAHGIPVIVLKGAFLAAIIYSDPAHRTMADVDLLLQRVDLERAELLLHDLGYCHANSSSSSVYEPRSNELPDYANHHHLPRLHKAGALPVELHRTLAPLQSGLRLDMDGMWHRARRARVGGVDVLVLSPEDFVLHLCIHAAYGHRFRVPIRSLYDLAATITHYARELDWPLLASRSVASGAGAAVSCTLRMVERMFGVMIPKEYSGSMAAEMQVAPALVDAALDIVLAGSLDLPSAYQEAREISGIRAQLSLLRRTVFPPLDRLRQIYPHRSNSRMIAAYYLYRPLDLLIRRGAFALNVLMRTSESRHASRVSDQRRLIDNWISGQERGNAALRRTTESAERVRG